MCRHAKPKRLIRRRNYGSRYLFVFPCVAQSDLVPDRFPKHFQLGDRERVDLFIGLCKSSNEVQSMEATKWGEKREPDPRIAS